MNARWLILISLYVAYVMHTYSRRTFQNVINYILFEEFLTEENLGIIITSQQIGYTVSKFVQPFILDQMNPKIFLVMTMLASFICILAMSYSSTIMPLISLYWIHGFCLAFAWPSLAKILKKMITESEFGFWWSILCTSSNLGAIFGSIISTLISDRFGWRKNLLFAASFNLFCGVIITLVFILCTVPETVPVKSNKSSSSTASSKFFEVLFNPVLTVNGLFIFAVYVTRYVISDWYQIYLGSINFPQITIASFIGMMEIGGIIGTIVAGLAADFFYNHFENWRNPRMLVLVIFGLLTAGIQHLLIFNVNAATTPLFLTTLGFFFGVFIYGPVAISGIIAIEAAPPASQGLSFAINIIYANLAMLVAGYPLSHIGNLFGWKVAFIMSYAGISICTLLVLFLRHMPTPLDNLEMALENDAAL